ncbi:TPA: 7-carboxy-7-deazaguanine synthase QueE [Candidatus Poribacteria bacterium]|nr:7-carboxy-7-deazaguanine synthase QueE [Candidatus Poribacteria bacterium]HIO79024.1 7-carboxy-7-deazaguanine synthase QueE [Candidatus Poribacteria bacterium]
MKYSELFYTIQGEGMLTGVPSVFFRTSYCNLRCIWCDTPYTSWEPEDKSISVNKVVEEITKYNCRYVVITGGEPFLQAKELMVLCHELSEGGHHITIETNATIYADVSAHLISMSPKLRNSNPKPSNRYFEMHQRERIRADVIHKFLDNYTCQLKFVMETPKDLEEIQCLQLEIGIPNEAVVLMPQGISAKEIQSKQEGIIKICKQNGYRYSPRVHVDLWGNRRGV